MGSKQITLVSIGTRGDIQPYCVLGRELADRGFNVAIATEKRLENLVVNEFGLSYRYIAGDSTGFFFQSELQKELVKGDVMTLLNLSKEWKAKYSVDTILNSYVEALKGSDIIVAGVLSINETFSIAEHLKAAWVPFLLGPMFTQTDNLWSLNHLFEGMWRDEKEFINAWRHQVLDLPPIESPMGAMGIVYSYENIPVLVGCSTLFCGPGSTRPAHYDPKKEHFLGPVFASPLELPEEITSFISSARANANPIIYIGFGSMPSDNPITILEMAIEVCALASCRAIVVAGWSELNSEAAISLLSKNAETLILVPDVSHAALFPKVDCVIHHCGIGTTNIALLSGSPQIPCPVMFEQPANAEAIVNMGVALRAHPYQSLSAQEIGHDVNAILTNTKDIQTKVKEIAALLEEESNGALDGYCNLIVNTPPLEGDLKTQVP
ncbi:hypothetical protein THRCLA_02545 [Thraustotheca clavata]|uniref:Uncharacterized protein n=1 Tax=Thraustotheca clavata TaxID=74557 RepID=A0A1W0A5K0_9STRA|nr:hypothetical protein THRCLA_02545 [Thraustotheca clavata]